MMKFFHERWGSLLVCGLIAALVAYIINRGHPNWGVEDYTKLAAIWFTLFGVMFTGWVAMRNTDHQIKVTEKLAKDQQAFTTMLETLRRDFQMDLEAFKKQLALELEEAKVKFAQRYAAQAGLNRAAMIMADRINRLQLGSA